MTWWSERFALAVAIVVFIGVSLATASQEDTTSPEIKRIFEG